MVVNCHCLTIQLSKSSSMALYHDMYYYELGNMMKKLVFKQRKLITAIDSIDHGYYYYTTLYDVLKHYMDCEEMNTLNHIRSFFRQSVVQQVHNSKIQSA